MSIFNHSVEAIKSFSSELSLTNVNFNDCWVENSYFIDLVETWFYAEKLDINNITNLSKLIFAS